MVTLNFCNILYIFHFPEFSFLGAYYIIEARLLPQIV